MGWLTSGVLLALNKPQNEQEVNKEEMHKGNSNNRPLINKAADVIQVGDMYAIDHLTNLM